MRDSVRAILITIKAVKLILLILLWSRLVAYVLDRKQFLLSRTGGQFIADNDPGLMSYLFPHLDPWDIGGFYHTFRSDPHFAFVWRFGQRFERRCTFIDNFSGKVEKIGQLQAMQY